MVSISGCLASNVHSEMREVKRSELYIGLIYGQTTKIYKLRDRFRCDFYK